MILVGSFQSVTFYDSMCMVKYQHNLLWAQICLYKKLLYGEDDQTPQRVSKRGCGVSIFHDIQNPIGHIPEQPALVGLTLARILA